MRVQTFLAQLYLCERKACPLTWAKLVLRAMGNLGRFPALPIFLMSSGGCPMLNSLRRVNATAFHVRMLKFFALLLFVLLAGEFGQAQAAGITLVQHVGKDAGTTTTSTLAFASANTAGNFIAVAIRGGLSSSQVFTVTDSNGNTYKQAAQIGSSGSAVTTAIYYAEN